MSEVLKFSTTKPAEAQFRRILMSSPKGISPELFQSAASFLNERDYERRFSDPAWMRVPFDVRFTRLAEQYPAAFLVYVRGSGIGPNAEGLVSAEEIAGEYQAEEG